MAAQPDIVTNPMASAQMATVYGPQTQQALRRSQYLADALKQQLVPEQNPRSVGEMAARLLATAILSRANDKGQDALIKAMQADQSDETTRMLAPLQVAPSAPPAAPVPQAPPPPAATPTPAATPDASGLSDADKLAIARTVYGEARGEPLTGQQAVASVILNRARGSGKSPAEVAAAPHQFAG